MIRLIIVDDEKTTRNSLQEYISWNKLGIVHVFTAQNGLDALEMAKKTKPDILLTDIRMPKMDGIELAFKVRKLYPDCAIIFLSGYTDKEYLKKAIHLQAISYIEKPISIEEVKAVIRRTVQERLKRAEENAKEIKLRENLARSLPLIRREIAVELVKGEADPAELAEKYGEVFLNLPSAEFFTPVCLLVNWHPEVEEGTKISLKRDILDILSGKNFPKFSVCLAGFEDDEKIIIIFAGRCRQNQTADILEQLIAAKFPRLSKGRFNLSAGIGPTVRSLANLPQSYRKAVATAANTQFYARPGRIHTYRGPTSARFQPEKELFQHFRAYLSRNERLRATELVEELTAKIRFTPEDNINRVKNIYFNLLLIIFEVARDRGFIYPYDENEKNYIWEEIEKIKTLSELSSYINLNIESVFSRMEGQNAVPNKTYEIMTYIKENYAAKDLSVQSIADHIYLSHTYLCAFFKKNTGKTINEYITEIRIEKAKELLREGKMKLYEIADHVGYTDPNYFSSLFKKHTGCTPSQFKEKIGLC